MLCEYGNKLQAPPEAPHGNEDRPTRRPADRGAAATRILASAHRRGARVRRLALPRIRATAPRVAGPALRTAAGIRCRTHARFPPRYAVDPGVGLDDRAPAARPARSPGRDHRPHGPQDGHQRAQLGCLDVHGGLRGRELSHLGQHDLRPGEPDGRRAPRDHPRAVGQALPAERAHGGTHPAPARLAPGREACAPRRPAGVGEPVRLRPALLPQRGRVARASERPVLLPAEARIAPRGAPLERHLHHGAEAPRRAARLRARHRADRDHARRLRDGRDPVGAAGTLGGTEHRPLGLHLLVHQEAALAPRVLPRRPRAGDDDLAVHAGLRAAAGQDLPPPQRSGHGRHGGADPDQERSGGQRGGDGQGARRQGARGRRRLRRHLGRAPGAGGDRQGSVRPAHAGAQPVRPPAT